MRSVIFEINCHFSMYWREWRKSKDNSSFQWSFTHYWKSVCFDFVEVPEGGVPPLPFVPSHSKCCFQGIPYLHTVGRKTIGKNAWIRQTEKSILTMVCCWCCNEHIDPKTIVIFVTKVIQGPAQISPPFYYKILSM